jgi:hypothetical protein
VGRDAARSGLLPSLRVSPSRWVFPWGDDLPRVGRHRGPREGGPAARGHRPPAGFHARLLPVSRPRHPVARRPVESPHLADPTWGTCYCCGSVTWPLPDRRGPLACGVRGAGVLPCPDLHPVQLGLPVVYQAVSSMFCRPPLEHRPGPAAAGGRDTSGWPPLLAGEGLMQQVLPGNTLCARYEARRALRRRGQGKGPPRSAGRVRAPARGLRGGASRSGVPEVLHPPVPLRRGAVPLHGLLRAAPTWGPPFCPSGMGDTGVHGTGTGMSIVPVTRVSTVGRPAPPREG